MSTLLTLLVSSGGRPQFDQLFAEADRWAAEFDHRHQGSPVWRINHGQSVHPPAEVLRTLELAKEIAALSGGAFDPTVLPLTSLWSFDTGGRLPVREEILETLSRIDYRKLQIQDGQVSLPPGYGLDLGGIAKGAVVDLLGADLLRRGLEDYLIDAGGDILVSGLKEGRLPWGIAIRHPRRENSVLGVLRVGEAGERRAVVTSGDYERSFEQNGRRYHHILDPHTGYPAEGLASVTVLAASCAQADGLATAAFVLGRRDGLELLERLPGVEGLLVWEKSEGGLAAEATTGFPLRVEELDLK